MGTFSDNLGRLSNLDSLFPVVRTFYFHVHGMFIQYQIRLVMRNFLPGDLPERLSYEKKNGKKLNPDEITSIESIAWYRNNRLNYFWFFNK